MITLDTINKDLHSIAVDDGGGSITVDAVDLDIRDLAFATDKVDVSGSSVSISGDVNVTQGTSPWVIGDGGGSITVDAVNLDIRDLAFATDKVDVGGSIVALDSTTLAALESITVQNGAGASAVNIQDGGNSITVDAVDLDIRDLSHSQDSVKIGDGTDFLAINGDGSINAQFTESGYASWKVTTATVNTSESQLVSSPLANRLRVEIQNLGTKDVWIRQITGVSTSNGLKIPKGSSYEQALDAGASIFAISDGASADLRIAEYAA